MLIDLVISICTAFVSIARLCFAIAVTDIQFYIYFYMPVSVVSVRKRD